MLNADFSGLSIKIKIKFLLECIYLYIFTVMPRHSEQMEDIPIVIGGKEYRTENVQYQVMVSSL